MSREINRHAHSVWILVGLLVLGLTGVASLRAQVVSTAQILGTVTDSSGAAVVGAMVTVKNTNTGVTNTTVTDAQGRYEVQQLIIGTYEVTFEAAGFQKLVHGGVTLTVGSNIVVDGALQVGTVQQTVTVEADVTHVETTSATISNLVEQTQLQDLPLNERNYYGLIVLAPGVMSISGGGLGTFYGDQTNYTVSGVRPSGQAYLVDDTNTGDFWNHSSGNGTLGTQLGVDSIAEFSTELNNYGAQFGGNGTAFNASTKSGTNSFHGSAYEYLLNSGLSAANNFVPTSAPLQKAFDNRNQFGASLGGPIKKNKAFFFGNYEALREQQVSYSQLSEPDLNARGCSGMTLAACQADGGVGPNTPIFFNAATTGPNPNQFVAIPWAKCGSQLGYSASQYPLGNTCAAAENAMSQMSIFPIGYLADNAISGVALTANVGNPTHSAENYGTGRLDYTISDKDSIFAKLTIDKGYDVKYGQVPLFPENDFTTDTYVTLEERHIFSPTLLNTAHLSYVRPDEEGYQNQNPAITIPAAAAGLGGVGAGQPYANCFGCATNAAFGFFDFEPTVQGRSDYVAISQAARGAAGNAQGISITGTQPFYLIPNNFTLGDDVIWTKGAHSIKFGMNVERMDENTWAPFVTAGSWTATTNVLSPFTSVGGGTPTCTPVAGAPANSPCSTGVTSSLAAFVAGQFTGAGPGELPESVLAAQNLIPQDGTVDARETLFSPYFQDDWKVTNKLTLNLGVRYSPTLLTSLKNHVNENLLNAPWDGTAYGSTVTSENSPIGPNGQPSFPAGTNCLTPTATSNGGAPLTCGWVPVTHPFAQNISLRNIDPRIGVAFDPFKDHKTSIRAGLGFYHVVIVERDWDMWIQPPALPGTETIPTTTAPGSPFTYPFEFTSPGASPVVPCAFVSQPTIPIGASAASGGVSYAGNAAAGQYANCLSVTSGGATYYGATKTPYDMQYNISIQREIMPQTIVTIGYVGNRGVDLVSQRDFNAYLPCGGTDPVTGSPIYVQGFAPTAGGWITCPRQNPSMGGVSLLNPTVPSWYNALQIQINRRFSKGFQLQASYSWQKAVDIVDGSYGLDGGGNVTDPYSYGVSQGANSNTRPQLLTVSTVYQLPFHKNLLVSGWQAQGIYTFLGGAPFTVSGATRGVAYGQTVDWAPNNPGCNGNAYTGVSPDAAVNQYVTGVNNAGQFPIGPATASIVGGITTPYLNGSCFTPAPAGELGTLGKNTFYGPTDWNLDFSILKDTKITKISEQFNLEFRAEFFNVFNHPYWGAPANLTAFAACNSPSCGQEGGITTVGAAQQPNNVTNTFGGFGNPTSTPRRIQFALRATF